MGDSMMAVLQAKWIDPAKGKIDISSILITEKEDEDAELDKACLGWAIVLLRAPNMKALLAQTLWFLLTT